MYHTTQPTEKSTYLPVTAFLFFMWGLVTVINGLLVPLLMNALELDYFQALIIVMCFYGAYLIMSVPAGKIIDKLGYKNGIIIGVGMAGIGCFVFYLAANNFSLESIPYVYSLSVLSMIILGSGITILQVAANPYVVLVGRRGKGAQRLTFMQAFNSLGTVLATILAGRVMVQVDQSLEPIALRASYASSVEIPYLILALVLIVLAIALKFIPLPAIQTDISEPLIKEKIPARKHVLEFPHVAIGCIAIFLYVGAEVSIFNFLVAKMNMADTIELENKISIMIILFWSGMMAGRFVGARLLKDLSPRKMLIIGSSIAFMILLSYMLITASVISMDTSNALWLLTSLGLFNSVLFPCLFTMGMDGLGKFSEEASSYLIMSLVGGAIVPYLFVEALSIGPIIAFAILLFAYMFIAYFGFKGSRYEKRTNFY